MVMNYLRDLLHSGATVKVIVTNSFQMVQCRCNRFRRSVLMAYTICFNDGTQEVLLHDREDWGAECAALDRIIREKLGDDAADMFQEIIDYSQAVVDGTLRANVDFQGRAGRRPKIIRKSEWKCCDWCRHLVGEYEYPDVPDDIYRRHENCRCTVEYDPGDGTRQNVHTKKLTQAGQSDTIEERRKTGLGNLGTFRPNDHHNTIQKYVGINRADVAAAAKAGKTAFWRLCGCHGENPEATATVYHQPHRRSGAPCR